MDNVKTAPHHEVASAQKGVETPNITDELLNHIRQCIDVTELATSHVTRTNYRLGGVSIPTPSDDTTQDKPEARFSQMSMALEALYSRLEYLLDCARQQDRF
jgi:hypothetical protein